MNRFVILPAIAFAAFTLSATAQNLPPVVSSQIADFTEYAGGTRSIDLVRTGS